MKIRAIVNLRAGLAAHRALDAMAAGRPSWPAIEVRLTEGPAHATALAREAVDDEAALVLAAGGDGTVNEVATALIGTDVPLGIVPVGSGNGLARALALPLRPDRALAALETGIARRMDIGRINGSPFLNVAGVGFDAFVGWAFHKAGLRGGRRGIFTYIQMSLRLLSLYQARPLTLSLGGEPFESRPFVLAFANGPQYGAGAVLNPGAKLNDGRIELVIYEDGPFAETLLDAPRLFLGGIERARRYRRIVMEHATLLARQPVEHHRDGEPEPEALRLKVEVLPKALRVLVPRATAEDPAGPFLPG